MTFGMLKLLSIALLRVVHLPCLIMGQCALANMATSAALLPVKKQLASACVWSKGIHLKVAPVSSLIFSSSASEPAAQGALKPTVYPYVILL